MALIPGPVALSKVDSEALARLARWQRARPWPRPAVAESPLLASIGAGAEPANSVDVAKHRSVHLTSAACSSVCLAKVSQTENDRTLTEMHPS